MAQIKMKKSTSHPGKGRSYKKNRKSTKGRTSYDAYLDWRQKIESGKNKYKMDARLTKEEFDIYYAEAKSLGYKNIAREIARSERQFGVGEARNFMTMIKDMIEENPNSPYADELSKISVKDIIGGDYSYVDQDGNYVSSRKALIEKLLNSDDENFKNKYRYEIEVALYGADSRQAKSSLEVLQGNSKKSKKGKKNA